jgi:hypothetical protein
VGTMQTLRLVSLGVGALSALTVVFLAAAGVAGVAGNSGVSRQLFGSVVGVWFAVVVAGGFVMMLDRVVTE